MKKLTIVLVLTLCLLFTFSSLASAELLFGVTAETGSPNFSTTYKGIYDSLYTDVSASPNMITLTGDLNLFLIHIGLEYGTANIGSGSTFTTTTVKAGWELGLPIFKAQLYGGYQSYVLTNETLSLGNCAYASMIAGLGFESQLANFTLYGNTYFPLTTNYIDGITTDGSASLSYLKVGVAYAPLPFVDLFVDYRSMSAKSTVMELSAEGYNFGVKFSF